MIHQLTLAKVVLLIKVKRFIQDAVRLAQEDVRAAIAVFHVLIIVLNHQVALVTVNRIRKRHNIKKSEESPSPFST
jgi:hypothetical protein